MMALSRTSAGKCASSEGPATPSPPGRAVLLLQLPGEIGDHDELARVALVPQCFDATFPGGDHFRELRSPSGVSSRRTAGGAPSCRSPTSATRSDSGCATPLWCSSPAYRSPWG